MSAVCDRISEDMSLTFPTQRSVEVNKWIELLYFRSLVWQPCSGARLIYSLSTVSQMYRSLILDTCKPWHSQRATCYRNSAAQPKLTFCSLSFHCSVILNFSFTIGMCSQHVSQHLSIFNILHSRFSNAHSINRQARKKSLNRICMTKVNIVIWHAQQHTVVVDWIAQYGPICRVWQSLSSCIQSFILSSFTYFTVLHNMRHRLRSKKCVAYSLGYR